MARTRASRAGAVESAPRSRRATLARRSKPSQPLLDSSESEDIQDERSDLSIASESDSEDDFDGGVDRSMGDLDIDAARERAGGLLRRGRRNRANQMTTSQSITMKTSRRDGPPKRTLTKRTFLRGRKRGHPSTASTPSKRPKASQNGPMPHNSGTIPDWLDPQIPYSAWIDIFYYAAMADDGMDNSWLVYAASTCKAFLEPALTALYRCPQLLSPAKAKKLVVHLNRHLDTEGMINYHTKVESLYVDSDYWSPKTMAELAVRLPRLNEMIPFTRFDQPPYRELDRTIRWGHSPSVFAYMARPEEDTEDRTSVHPVCLKSWEWSGSLLPGAGMSVHDLVQLHESTTFVQLSRASFTNFQIPSLKKLIPSNEEAAQQIFNEDDQVIDAIASSITKLSQLKHLVFESSTVLNGRLLSQLPDDLMHLQLINCWEVSSDDLKIFLSTHGRNMRFLTLNHNQSLDLAFLTDLETHCPKLEELRVNMSYYRLHHTVNDSDPMYDQALLPGQLPLWPPLLRVIEIDHVHQWSVEAAEMFLQSLVDSAPNLPQLRHLTVKTTLDIPWQRRAEMRQGWREKFDAVFLRPWVPPNVHTTLREEATRPLVISDGPPKKRRKKPDAGPSRRSGRIAAHSDSDPGPYPLRAHSKPRYIDPDTDADELSSSDEEEAYLDDQRSPAAEVSSVESKDQPLPFQGLCQTVDIMIDNQKARELQYGMEDFQDDHTSSGDEWDGDNDEEDTYAW